MSILILTPSAKREHAFDECLGVVEGSGSAECSRAPLDSGGDSADRRGAEGVRQEQRLGVGVAGGSDNCLTSCVAPALVLNGAGGFSQTDHRNTPAEKNGDTLCTPNFK